MTEPTTAKARIADALERFQRNWERMLSPNASAEDRQKSSINVIHFFSLVTLLETLRQQDEQAADRLTRWLDSMFEDDLAAEQIFHWRAALAEGRDIELPDLSS